MWGHSQKIGISIQDPKFLYICKKAFSKKRKKQCQAVSAPFSSRGSSVNKADVTAPCFVLVLTEKQKGRQRKRGREGLSVTSKGFICLGRDALGFGFQAHGPSGYHPDSLGLEPALLWLVPLSQPLVCFTHFIQCHFHCFPLCTRSFLSADERTNRRMLNKLSMDTMNGQSHYPPLIHRLRPWFTQCDIPRDKSFEPQWRHGAEPSEMRPVFLKGQDKIPCCLWVYSKRGHYKPEHGSLPGVKQLAPQSWSSQPLELREVN